MLVQYLLLLPVLLTQNAYGAVTIETGNISTDDNGGDNPITFSHTIAAGDDIVLVVMVSVESNSDIDDVDWGTNQLIEQIDTGQGGQCASEIWYIPLGNFAC